MITSAQNPLVKEFRRLRRDRKAREQAGLFVVEGIQGVVAAVEHHAGINVLLYAPALLTSERAYQAIEVARQRGVRCEELSVDLFESLSERENPVGIAALVQRRAISIDYVNPQGGDLFVALYEVGDPGNLGTVLRTVDAAGGAGLFLVGATVDPFHPSAVKASASTVFSVPVIQVDTVEALQAWARQHGVMVVGSSDKAPVPYWTLAYQTPLLFLMGSEAHGLPSEVMSHLDLLVSIPMHGQADSLNLGVATALLLYEVCRQSFVGGGL